VRLIHGDANPAGPGFKAEPVPSDVEGEHAGVEQVLRPGSYVPASRTPPRSTRAR
jgi:N,N-dimethylformamidase